MRLVHRTAEMVRFDNASLAQDSRGKNRFHRGTWSVGSGLCLWILLTFHPCQAQVITETGRTKDFDGRGVIVRTSLLRKTNFYRDGQKVDNPKDREVYAWILAVKQVLGLRPNWTLAITVPYIRKQVSFDSPSGRSRLSSESLGDIVLANKYRFFQRERLWNSLNFSLLGGVKIPSGAHTVSDAGVVLPPGLQPGSGSWDFLLGAAGTWARHYTRFDADFLYWRRTSRDDFGFGDEIRADISFRLRLLPRRYSSESFSEEVFFFVEANSIFRAHDEQNSLTLTDSGGQRVDVSPGVWWTLSPTFLVEGSFRIPVYRDPNGMQLTTDAVGILGARYLF